MRYSKMRCLFTLLLLMFSLCYVHAGENEGKIKYIDFNIDSTKVISYFPDNFAVLAKNRALYNTYNDSIFMIKDHDRWVSFFRRRALKNHQIFLADKVALDNIFNVFKADTINYENYVGLFNAFMFNYQLKSATDPFISLKVCKQFEEYEKVCPKSNSTAVVSNLIRGDAYLDLANFDNDKEKIELALCCYKKVISDECEGCPSYDFMKPKALMKLTGNRFLLNKVLTIEEHNHYFSMLKEWYQVHQNDTIFPKNFRKDMAYIILHHDEDLLRNVYLLDSTIMDKNKAEDLMRKVIKRNLASKNLTDISFIRTLTLQVRLGEISAKQAVNLYLARYKEHWKLQKKQKMSSSQLNIYVQPFFSFFYLNDISDVSFAKKCRIVQRMCRDIEMVYQNRKDQQYTTSYIKHLNTIVTYERITKYLTPKERIHFLNSLNVATQVTTYAHSVHVSMIAEELMKGILKYQPELLIGSLGDLQISEVVRHQKKYIKFAHDAAMYHDLGKNSIISVVNNDYRPLTDEEFAIIKKHPALGLQYLKLAPELAKFHDTTLGHHKWYNGKGGYPDNFDNTKSPKRILIDMVTLSDCMQAATERVGRNYKGEKNFDTVMAEFRRDAGVRYNPDLVALIDAHPDVAKKLADLINEGWVEIYYNIYSQFIK